MGKVLAYRRWFLWLLQSLCFHWYLWGFFASSPSYAASITPEYMRYKNLDTKYSGYYSLLSVIIFFADRVRKPILVEALLKAGVDTEIADSCKMRAVHWAARIGEDRIIDLYGAEISMRKINMEIPLCIGLCEPL